MADSSSLLSSYATAFPLILGWPYLAKLALDGHI